VESNYDKIKGQKISDEVRPERESDDRSRGREMSMAMKSAEDDGWKGGEEVKCRRKLSFTWRLGAKLQRILAL
jgi:hypothetical protein